MKINYFFREFQQHQISIEKLFDTIIKSIEKRGVKTYNIVNPYNFSIISIIRSMLYFRKNQAEINHITGDIHWAIFTLNAKKTILTIHDLVGINQYNGIKKWIYYIFWVYLPIKKAKYITVISDKTKNEILELIPSAESKITVIPNLLTVEPIDTNFLKQNKLLNVLVVGTRSNKNIEKIFDAAKGKQIEITIIGDLSSSQLQKINENNLHYNNLINISDEVLLNCYDNADVLCFPSLYEGFGLPILEAQARNCAVITSNISPLKEVAGDGAIFVDPNSVQDISEALDVLENDEIRLDLILKGKQNIKNYLPEIITEKYIFLYNEIINKVK